MLRTPPDCRINFIYWNNYVCSFKQIKQKLCHKLEAFLTYPNINQYVIKNKLHQL